MAAIGQTNAQRTGRFAFGPGVHDTAVALAARPSKAATAELGPLAAVATEVRFSAGANVILEGDPALHLFRITAGVVKVYRTLADGRCQITGFLFPGDFLGLAPEDVYL